MLAFGLAPVSFNLADVAVTRRGVFSSLAAAAAIPALPAFAKGVSIGPGKTKDGEIFLGGTDTLDLSAMLEDVPLDMKGETGIARDEAGVARLASEAPKKLSPKEAQAAKMAAFKAKQEADAEKGFSLPEVKIGLPF